MFALWFGLLAACGGDASVEVTGPGAGGPPSMVLVSVDTLRADRLAAYGHAEGLTPNLDRFAAEGVVFEHAYAQANETCFSHASLFTSRYPSELGRLDSGFRLPAEVPTLATMLKAYGYDTAAAVGGAYLSPAFGFAQGFDQYDPTVDWGSFWHTVPAALRQVDAAGDGPFFLFVHSYDAHARYLKPAPFGYLHADATREGPIQEAVRQNDGTLLIADGLLTPGVMPLEYLSRTRVRFSPADVRGALDVIGARAIPLSADDLAHVAGMYDGAVQYADAWFGRFMAQLEARGVLDEAWIVVVSDHGEDLHDHGSFNHRFTLAEDVVRVPLIVRPPGGKGGGRRVAGPVELVDVLPTLAEIAGATPPAGIRGQSLLAAVNGGAAPARRAAFSEGAFRLVSAADGRGRLTFSGLGPDDPWLPEVLAAARLDGPGFVAEGDADRAALRDALVEWRRSVVVAQAKAGAELPAELQKTLRAQGYWEVDP